MPCGLACLGGERFHDSRSSAERGSLRVAITKKPPRRWLAIFAICRRFLHALDALVTAMISTLMTAGQCMPRTVQKRGAHGYSVVAQVHLSNVRLVSGMKSADVARAMGIKPQRLARAFVLRHPTKIDSATAPRPIEIYPAGRAWPAELVD